MRMITPYIIHNYKIKLIFPFLNIFSFSQFWLLLFFDKIISRIILVLVFHNFSFTIVFLLKEARQSSKRRLLSNSFLAKQFTRLLLRKYSVKGFASQETTTGHSSFSDLYYFSFDYKIILVLVFIHQLYEFQFLTPYVKFSSGQFTN